MEISSKVSVNGENIIIYIQDNYLEILSTLQRKPTSQDNVNAKKPAFHSSEHKKSRNKNTKKMKRFNENIKNVICCIVNELKAYLTSKDVDVRVPVDILKELKTCCDAHMNILNDDERKILRKLYRLIKLCHIRHDFLKYMERLSPIMRENSPIMESKICVNKKEDQIMPPCAKSPSSSEANRVKSNFMKGVDIKITESGDILCDEHNSMTQLSGLGELNQLNALMSESDNSHVNQQVQSKYTNSGRSNLVNRYQQKQQNSKNVTFGDFSHESSLKTTFERNIKMEYNSPPTRDILTTGRNDGNSLDTCKANFLSVSGSAASNYLYPSQCIRQSQYIHSSVIQDSRATNFLNRTVQRISRPLSQPLLPIPPAHPNHYTVNPMFSNLYSNNMFIC